MKFTKMHGAGNDYIYIDARQMDEDWPALSRAMSNRHFGIGGDGIILVLDSDMADLRMRMFNADGSEGEMCGNGIRCFAKYAIERNIARPGESGLSVETLAGIRTIVPRMEGESVVSARVAMGEPRFDPAEVPVVLERAPERTIGAAVLNYPVDIDGSHLNLSFVSMGNPHAVAFIDQSVEEYHLHNIGPQVEHHPMFPRRVNFEIVNLIDPGHAKVRVWERGSGETMACGSGASAVAAIARLMGKGGDRIDITLPGGTLSIEWDGAGEVFMEGPAEEVFSGEW
ncbi:MAG: diaminopimelate epimerase [Dehalococcoidia bacterium]|nr:diaminopimelate epimerase [Dehalococcoidia bacterium]